jgi:signal transduction histidine kinase
LTGVDGPLLKEQTKVLERVQANIGRLQHLLVDLLDLCKIELGETSVDLQPVNAQTVLTQAIESLQPFASKRRVFIDMALPSMLPLVTADASKLHQIVTNLLHNALKFSPEFSTVRITGQTFSDGFARIAVQDSGCGIGPEEAEKIFEPFYRSKQVPTQTRGTGLGLSIAKHLVELHHGHLWVESERGNGACFFFTLPIWAHASPIEAHHTEPILLSK